MGFKTATRRGTCSTVVPTQGAQCSSSHRRIFLTRPSHFTEPSHPSDESPGRTSVHTMQPQREHLAMIDTQETQETQRKSPRTEHPWAEGSRTLHEKQPARPRIDVWG